MKLFKKQTKHHTGKNTKIKKTKKTHGLQTVDVHIQSSWRLPTNNHPHTTKLLPSIDNSLIIARVKINFVNMMRNEN